MRQVIRTLNLQICRSRRGYLASSERSVISGTFPYLLLRGWVRMTVRSFALVALSVAPDRTCTISLGI